MLITSVIQSFYTLNANTRRIDRDIQLYGATLFMVVAFLPIPLIIGGLVVPRKTRVEKFGSGRWRTKIAVLLTAASLLTLGAGFRAGTALMAPRPRDDPAWYQSKACFYIFDLGVEIVTIGLYAILRVDLRFHVPNGSAKAGDYSLASSSLARVKSVRVNDEEEVFDFQFSFEGEESDVVVKEEERSGSDAV